MNVRPGRSALFEAAAPLSEIADPFSEATSTESTATSTESATTSTESANLGEPTEAAPMDARRPLFSAPPRRTGTVVVVCSSCESRTPVPASQVAMPVSLSLLSPLWMLATYPHRLRCPACQERTWCRLG